MRLPAVLLVLTLAACATETVARDLYLDDTGRTIEAKRGDTVMVRLASDPKSGSRWEIIATPNPQVVRVTAQADEPPTQPEHGVVSGMGSQVWRLDMVGSGGTMLKLAYARPS